MYRIWWYSLGCVHFGMFLEIQSEVFIYKVKWNAKTKIHRMQKELYKVTNIKAENIKNKIL